MAMRQGISNEEYVVLRREHALPSMDEAAKIEFRRIRTEWAEEGHLPESFTERDIQQICDAAREKIAAMSALLRFKKIDPKEVRELFGKISFLKREKLVSEDVYRNAAEALLPWMGDTTIPTGGSGPDCDNE